MNQEQSSTCASSSPIQKVRVTIELSPETLAWIDELREQLGFRNRGIIIEQLLLELQPQEKNDNSRQSYVFRKLAEHFAQFLKNLRNQQLPSK
jgi:hypothetical protein